MSKGYVFISHPSKDKGNIDEICKYWIRQGYVPISPLHLFSFLKSDKGIREEIMQICYYLILKCKFVASYGTSEGCILEKKFALRNEIPVLQFYKGGYKIEQRTNEESYQVDSRGKIYCSTPQSVEEGRDYYLWL